MSTLQASENLEAFRKMLKEKSRSGRKSVVRKSALPREYVAISRGIVVGHAKTRPQLLKRLQKQGIKSNRVKIARHRIRLIL